MQMFVFQKFAIFGKIPRGREKGEGHPGRGPTEATQHLASDEEVKQSASCSYAKYESCYVVVYGL